MTITLRTSNHYMVSRFTGSAADLVLSKCMMYTKSVEAKDENKKVFKFVDDMKIELKGGMTMFFLEGFYLVVSN